MSDSKMTGTCKYCGQQVLVETRPGEKWTQAELDEEAEKTCSCEEARRQRRMSEQLAQVREYAEEEFGGQKERTELMLDAIDAVNRFRVDRVDIAISNAKYSVKYNEKRGTIVKKTVKMEREDTF